MVTIHCEGVRNNFSSVFEHRPYIAIAQVTYMRILSYLYQLLQPPTPSLKCHSSCLFVLHTVNLYVYLNDVIRVTISDDFPLHMITVIAEDCALFLINAIQ